MQRQRAPEELGEPSGNRQPEPGSFGELSLTELHEFLEDPLLIIWRDAFTFVDHLDDYAVVVAARQRDADGLPTTELDRIRQQVEQDLTHATRIGHHSNRLARVFDTERRSILVREWAHGDEQVLDQRGKTYWLEPQIDLAGFDLREVEDIVHQLEQVLGRFVRALDAFPLLLVQGTINVLEEQRAVSQYRVD